MEPRSERGPEREPKIGAETRAGADGGSETRTLEIETSRDDAGVCLTLRGDLVKEHVASLKDAVLAVVGESPAILTLDMAEVSYIDSSGLGTLIFIHKTWGKQRGRLILRNLSPMVRKFFSTTGLLGHFECAEGAPASRPRREEIQETR